MASKEAGKLVVGDVWTNGRHRFRVLATQPGPVSSIVRVVSKNLNNNKVDATDFYRVNRVQTEMPAEPLSA